MPPSSPRTSRCPECLRRQPLGEVVGQQHLPGEGIPLRIAFESVQPHSCILWGPPGTGETAIAQPMPTPSMHSTFDPFVRPLRHAVLPSSDGLGGGAQRWVLPALWAAVVPPPAAMAARSRRRPPHATRRPRRSAGTRALLCVAEPERRLASFGVPGCQRSLLRVSLRAVVCAGTSRRS